MHTYKISFETENGHLDFCYFYAEDQNRAVETFTRYNEEKTVLDVEECGDVNLP